MNPKIWLSSPHMGGHEQSFIQEAFDQNWVAPLGPNVTAFEQSLETYLGGDCHVAALSSGTAALQLALIMAGVGQNDVVLCQSFTFCGSANPILYLGATPVFIDSEPDTWNMDPILLEKAIKDYIQKGRKPKALVVVHLYGMPAQMNAIIQIAHQYGIKIIEDAAEALGSEYHGQKCGTLGDYGVLSFNGNKIITTSGGGALVCKSIQDKDKAVFLSTQARDEAPHFQHSQLGYNFRMSNILAGIGRGQMMVLPERVNQKRAINTHYQTLFQGDYQFQSESPKNTSNYWLTAILTKSYEKREAIRKALALDNIESRPLWKPMHAQPLYAQYDAYLNGVSDAMFEKGLCLPSDTHIGPIEWQRIQNIVLNIV